MTVSLLEVLVAARVHAAPLAAESAGYLLLGVADHLSLAPRSVVADEVELSSDGAVRLRAHRAGASGPSPELAVRRLLGRALQVASAAGPALRRAAERREEAGLDGLVRELEIALIPVNRAAAKRALSRLHRETERARDAGKLEAQLQSEAAIVPTPAPLSEAIAIGADFPDRMTPAPALPTVAAAPVVAALAAAPVVAAPTPTPAPIVMAGPSEAAPARVAAALPAFLSPPPLPITEDQLALTKPEPVVARARERGTSTPRLGTLITVQCLPGEESERTERAPAVELASESDEELDLSIDVELELELEPELQAEAPSEALHEAQPEAHLEAQPEPARASSPLATPFPSDPGPQPLTDPEPSRLPDVLSAMLALHVGVMEAEAEAEVEAEADAAPTLLRDVVTEPRAVPPPPIRFEVEAPPASAPDIVLSAPDIVLSDEPELVLSEPSFEPVDPAVHEALTWNPGPVVAHMLVVPASLRIAEPELPLEPYAPAVLESHISDVSELLDAFHVSGASEERELRGALKEMAGLEPTPMPHPLVEEG
ncbi:MAG TPA: hypothetical protein VIW29_20845 [Polyangiaceae bacterium]